MQQLGIPYNIAVFGAHIDCLLHTGQKDSKDDQLSIKLGYQYGGNK